MTIEAWLFPTNEPLYIAVSARASMQRVDARTRLPRLKIAQEVLAALLRSAPPDARVQLMSYGAHVHIASANNAHNALTSLDALTAGDVGDKAGYAIEHAMLHLLDSTAGRPLEPRRCGQLLLVTDGPPTDLLRWIAWADQNELRGQPLAISVLKLADFDASVYCRTMTPRFRAASVYNVALGFEPEVVELTFGFPGGADALPLPPKPPIGPVPLCKGCGLPLNECPNEPTCKGLVDLLPPTQDVPAVLIPSSDELSPPPLIDEVGPLPQDVFVAISTADTEPVEAPPSDRPEVLPPPTSGKPASARRGKVRRS